MNSRTFLRPLVCVVISLAGFVSSAISQQTQTAEPSPQQSVGQRAVNIVLKQVTLDPTALAPKTGKPLPIDGAWSVGKEAPISCPQESQCVTVFYRVPEDDVLCQWVIDLSGTNNGVILEQNEDASRYLIRKVSLDQAAKLVLTRKQPIYPPIAMAAHVQGPVVLRLFISDAGTVDKAIIVSGPEMLRASAIDAAKKWAFQPLETGKTSTRFETEVTFDFKTMGPGSTSKITSKP
jgi:TonB family protein